MNILLVEDEALVALEMVVLLEDEGHRVVGQAADATTALALARSHTPDLTLNDIALADGEGAGMTLTREVTRLGLAVLVVTAHGARLRPDLDGACAALIKPFSASHFRRAIAFAAAASPDAPERAEPPPGLIVPAKDQLADASRSSMR